MKYKISSKRNPRTQQTLFCPASVSPEVFDLKKVAQRIEDLSSLSRGDIMNVLDNLQRVVAQELVRGNSVRLGLLGSFRPSIRAKGVPLAKDVTPELIKSVKVVYTPSTEVRAQLSVQQLRFEKVSLGAKD